jgi:hypothetical protein
MQNKKEEEEELWKGERRGCLSGYNSNITDEY